MVEQSVWEPFRSDSGAIYFTRRTGRKDRHGRWELDWESSSDQVVSGVVVGDGILAVNDSGAWDCFEDHSRGERYFVNKISGEKTWRVPPGCEGKLPVNTKASWRTFVCEERNNRRYYFNVMTRECTWTRPEELGPALPEEPGNDGHSDAEFVAEDGSAFVIPMQASIESDFSSDDDSGQLDNTVDNSVSNTVDNSVSSTVDNSVRNSDGREYPDYVQEAQELQFDSDQHEKPQSNLEQSRLMELRAEYEAESRERIRERFIECLEEKGVQPFSQWVNWFSKVASDERVQDVPLEERGKWFNKYVRSLIGKEKEMRRRRIKACRRELRQLFASHAEAKTLVQDEASLIQVLEAELKNQQSILDKTLLRRCLQSLRILSLKDQAKACHNLL